MIKAVLTGDVIHSTRMHVEQRNWLLKQIAGALKLWSKDFKIRSEIFRGDSFQCVVKNPSEALKIALIQKTFIRSLQLKDSEQRKKKGQPLHRRWFYPYWTFDARIAIGIGEIDTLKSKLAASGGKAFQLSGQLLDKMKNKKQSLAIATDDKYKDELETEFSLLDAIILKTTPLQCEVINLKLLGYTENEIASQLKIIQSAVNQRSTSGNWNAIDAMLKRFEKIYTNE